MTEYTMYEAFKEAANKAPHDLAIYYEGKRINFKTLLKRVDMTADILYNRLGVRENDVVVIAQPNIPETIVLFYALNKIGATSNLIHPFTPFNQVKQIMDKTNTKVAFLFEQRIAKEVKQYREIADKVYVTRIEDDLPLMSKFIYHNFMNFRIRRKLGKMPARFKFDGFKYTYQLKPTGKEVPTAKADKNRCSVLLHSGSTTGKPKTICLSDYAFNFISQYAYSFLAVDKDKMQGHKMLSVLPSFHGFGLCMTMHAPLVNSFSSILVPKFKATKVVKAMNATKLTCMCGVPTIYEKLLQEPTFVNSKNLKHLHCCFCGGDSMPSDLEDRFNKAMEKAGWTQINEGIYEMKDNPYQVYIFEKNGYEFAKHEVYNVGLVFEKHDYLVRFSIAYDTANMSTEELTKLLGDCTSISDFKLAAKNPADNGDIIYGYQNSSGDICTVSYVENSDILNFEYTWQASVIY